MPQEESRKKSRNTSRAILIVVAVLVVVAFVGFLAMLAKLPPNTVARGVRVGPFDVGGLSFAQAQKLIETQTDAMENRGVKFVFKNAEVDLQAVTNGAGSPDVAQRVFDYDPGAAVAPVLAAGYQGGGIQQFFDRLKIRIFGINLPLVYSLDENQVKNFLHENFSVFEKPTTDAALSILSDNNKMGVAIIPESAGKQFVESSALQLLREHLDALDPSAVALRLQDQKPAITKAEAERLVPLIETSLNQGDITFVLGNKKVAVSPKQWGGWLRFVKSNGIVAVDVNKDKVRAFFKNTRELAVDAPVQEPKFSIKNGKVAEFQAGQAGERIDLESAYAIIKSALFESADRTVRLSTIKDDPQITIDKINDLGIKELVGVATTSFKGSPPNRRYNIKVGADSLNGILVMPGETFSLLKALGKIDGQHGYLPELVIKGNKTVPEFGGGLCQIATTFFRTVLNAGVPVLERQNHSYRVVYYEPAGIDATIYDPWPDFKFSNDTGHYILIQAFVKGDIVGFEFWGTRDGRIASQTKPILSNIRAPAPAKLTETLDLPPGKKKCSELAHAGADAVFTYSVTYHDGTVKKQIFQSKYRPWQAVCLIGVEKLSEPPAGEPGATPETGLDSGATVPPTPPSSATST